VSLTITLILSLSPPPQAVAKLDKVTPANVAKARTSLGLSLEDVEGVNILVYKAAVVDWFESHQNSFTDEGVERMAKLAAVLCEREFWCHAVIQRSLNLERE
jgi:hypothetical protein